MTRGIKMIELGSEVKDIVTGLKGIATGRTIWSNGCVRYAVQGKVDKDGKVPDLYWVDEEDIVEIKKPVKKLLKEKMGGPRPNPQRNVDPQR